MQYTFKKNTLALLLSCLFIVQFSQAQKKKLKSPSSRVGITSVDAFVRESFNLYDKVYLYDDYAEQNKTLTEDDYEILIDTIEDAQEILITAPDAITDLDGVGAIKQSKGALQINRAKRALKYSIKTSKKLLSKNNKKSDHTENDESKNQ